MLSQIVTFSGLLAVSWFTPSVEAQRMAPVRLSPRATDYVWTVTWTGPKVCTSWPCSYSYEVSGPAHDAVAGSVPLFDATCQGTVDQPLQTCSLASTQAADAAPITVSGNFSTYETSGVGNGLIDIKATWVDQASGAIRTLTGVTPLQASTENINTWTVDPEGCPVTDCTAARAVRRGSLGTQI
ncbi:hypothetical protein F4859DRAFT_332959 [Xylaria cf. heliscus]|nr:hypothetical protein F4859DRAFT_332959 [Xylaria cf. heliscus]